jgi:hypothetical protein
MSGAAAFAAEVLSAVRTRLEHYPSFTFAEVAAALGPAYSRGGDAERKLRRILDRLRHEGMLANPARGEFAAGPRLAASGMLGPGVELREGLRRLFENMGGFLFVTEARALLGVDGEAGERALTRALRAGGYAHGLPIAGAWRVWRIADDQARRRLVLPGFRLALDTRAELKADNGPWAAPIASDLYRRRREIGASVQTAREGAGLDVEDILADATVAAIMERCLRQGRREHLVVDGTQTLGAWFAGRADKLGLDNALALSWCDLEEGAPEGRPCIADALDVQFWKAAAQLLGADPVALSRGRTPVAGH